MKLLQSEIDANPASSPTMQPNTDGRIQQSGGVAVLDLVNSSESENNFWVWVRAARPEDAWLEKFCRLEALGAVHGVQDNLENGKYKAYVRQRDSRRLSIKVDPPMQPESRAGVYDMVATVQSQVPLRIGNEEQSVFEYPFRVVVRPYATWSLNVEPAETPVRIFRRKAIVWATVENTGNDWLYVDLKLPKETGQLSFERDTERIAVPSAVSAKSPSTRRIPIRVRSKYRNIRGTAIRVPVPLTATRIDAPSVPRFPSTADIMVPSLNLSSPVLIEATTDTKSASGAEVAYFPPIPASFTDFVTSLRTNLMALLTLFLMLTAAFFAGTYMYENLVHKYEYNRTKVSPETIPQGGTVTITGPKLGGSDVEVKLGDKLLRSDAKVESGDIKVTILKDPSIPPGAEVVINIKRRGLGFLSWPPIFPALPVRVKIGEAVKERGTLTLQIKSTVMLGETLIIKNNGKEPFGQGGTIEFGTDKLEAVWKGSVIEATIPDDPAFARADTLYVTRADGMAKGEHPLTIKDPNAATTAGADGGMMDAGAAAGADGGAVADGGAPSGDSGGGTTDGGGEGGSGGQSGSTTGGGGFQASAAYNLMTKAIQEGDSGGLLDAAAKAEQDKGPHWQALALYAYAQRGKKARYDALYEAMQGAPPANEDAAGWALYTMALAEYARAESVRLASAGDRAASAQSAAEAKAQYGVLANNLRSLPDLELPKLALARYRSGRS